MTIFMKTATKQIQCIKDTVLKYFFHFFQTYVKCMSLHQKFSIVYKIDTNQKLSVNINLKSFGKRECSSSTSCWNYLSKL
jgi:hypothetical protein